jgi:enoyl-CoA hydratase/carnithine racemase
VLRGEGDMFTSGNDVGEFAAIAAGAVQGERHVSRFIRALGQSTRPLVAAVQGRAVGVGTTMLLHCDYIVAGTDAHLVTPFAALGLVPEAASSLLGPRLMGQRRAFEFLVMGHPLDGAKAKEFGIANVVVPPSDVDAVALKAAHEIAALPPGAVALARRLMRGTPDELVARIDEEARIFSERLRSPEAKAAFEAFFARKR